MSRSWTMSYVDEHRLEARQVPEFAVAKLATARLHWLLQRSRCQVSGIFTLTDISHLLNCYQGELFFPEQFDSLATDLCSDLGIELECASQSVVGELVQKLLLLTPTQRLVVGDLLEQAWHRGLRSAEGLEAFIRGLGVELL